MLLLLVGACMLLCSFLYFFFNRFISFFSCSFSFSIWVLAPCFCVNSQYPKRNRPMMTVSGFDNNLYQPFTPSLSSCRVPANCSHHAWGLPGIFCSPVACRRSLSACPSLGLLCAVWAVSMIT